MGVAHNHVVTGTDNPAYQVSKNEYNAAHTLTAQGGVPSGSGSFPGGPSTDDLYYRTDRHLLYYYDGTRWLTVSEYTLESEADNQTTNTGGHYLAIPSATDIYLETVTVAVYVVTTNDGSHYWTITANKVDIATGSNTSLGGVNTSADTHDHLTPHVITVNAVVAMATYSGFITSWAKTSTPGALYVGSTYKFRLVG